MIPRPRVFKAQILIPVALLSALIILLHSQWTWKDGHYPLDDAGAYAQVAQEIYLVGKIAGPVHALWFAYQHRHWKPLLGQHLLSPFLFLTDGDVRAAFRIYSSVFSIFLILAIFAGLKRWGGDTVTAFLGSMLITLTPWMLFDHFNFGAELPWLLTSVLALTFLGRAPWWAAVFLALSLMCRPLESAVVLVPPFAAYLLLGQRHQWRHGGIFLFELLAMLGISRLPFILRSPQGYSREFIAWEQWLVLALWLGYCAVKLFGFRKNRDRCLEIQGQWTLLLTLLLFWYLPCFRALWNWVLMTSIGDMVKEAYAYRTIHENFAKLFFQYSGVLIFLPLFAAALAAPRRWWKFLTDHRPAVFLVLWCGFALAIIGSLTDSRDFRYYQLSWTILFGFGVVTLARTTSSQFHRISSYVCVTGLIAIQAYGSLLLYFSKNPWDRSQWPGFHEASTLAGRPITYRIRSEDSEFERLTDFLLTLDLPANTRFTFIDSQNERGVLPMTNPWKFTLRSREKGKYWDFINYYHHYGAPLAADELVVWSRRHAEVLIVGPPNFANAKAPQENTLAELYQSCADKNCPELGVKLIAKLPFPETTEHPEFTFLILKVLDSQHPPFDFLDCYKTVFVSKYRPN